MGCKTQRIEGLFQKFFTKYQKRIAVAESNENKLTLEIKICHDKSRRVTLALNEDGCLTAVVSMRQICMADELHAALLLMDMVRYPSYTLALCTNDCMVLKYACRAAALDDEERRNLTLRPAADAERIENFLQQGMMFESGWRHRAMFALEQVHYKPSYE